MDPAATASVSKSGVAWTNQDMANHLQAKREVRKAETEAAAAPNANQAAAGSGSGIGTEEQRAAHDLQAALQLKVQQDAHMAAIGQQQFGRLQHGR